VGSLDEYPRSVFVSVYAPSSPPDESESYAGILVLFLLSNAEYKKLLQDLAGGTEAKISLASREWPTSF
jgi:hypothetical protein